MPKLDSDLSIHGVDFVGHIILFYMLHREVYFLMMYWSQIL
jgi:hypothetical protein